MKPIPVCDKHGLRKEIRKTTVLPFQATAATTYLCSSWCVLFNLPVARCLLCLHLQCCIYGCLDLLTTWYLVPGVLLRTGVLCRARFSRLICYVFSKIKCTYLCPDVLQVPGYGLL